MGGVAHQPTQAFSVFHAASVYYTEQKLKNKKRGRPGNEATTKSHQCCFLTKLDWKACVTSLVGGVPGNWGEPERAPH